MWSLFIYVSSMNTMFAGYITKNVICTECYRTVETVRTCNDAYSKTNRSAINLYTINVVQIVRNRAAIAVKFTVYTLISVECMGMKTTWHNGKV